MHSRIVSKLLRQNPSRRRLLQALGFACLTASALSTTTARAQTVYTWHGGTGTWETPGLWDTTPAVPDSNDADVYIDGGKTGTASVVTMNNSHTVGRLTVDAGDTLNIGDNVNFYLASSFAGSESIINNGTINFNSAGNGVYLHYIGGNASLTGTGTINMTGANDRIYAQNGGGDRLTIGAGSTIAGTGNLGVGQSTFTNNGLVNANLSGQTLALQPGGGNGNDFTNVGAGIAQASNGGTLQFANNGNYNGGTFRALAGSFVDLSNSANVNNAILTTVGSGEVHVTNQATLNNVTNNGTLIADNNSTTYFTGTLTNNSTFTLNSTGNGDDLRFVGSATLAGTGTVVLTGSNDRVFANNGGGDRLTINSGASITGTGNLGLDQSTFTNYGVVNANVNGQTLTIQPGSGNGNDFTNNNVAEATSGGTLSLVTNTFTGSGVYQALTGSTITIGGNATVSGTTLTTAGSGTIHLTDTATLASVTNNGTLVADNNSTTSLSGTLTNNGTFTLNSTANGDDLRFAGATTLAGSGTLNLVGPSDRVYAQNGGGDRLTIAAGATLAGQGNLGIGQSTFTNNGTVNANQSGQSLILQPGGGNGSDFTSATGATTEASNGGILVLQNNGNFTGAGGFKALTGSQITLTGNPNVSNTTLSTTGTGTIVNADNASLTNVTVNGTFNAANNSSTYIAGTLTNNGTFSLNSTGNGDDLHFVGATTLAGIGTVVLNGASDRVFAQNGGGDRLTINAGSAITGNGNLGIGQSTFTNGGVVNANVSGQSLYLQPGGGNGSDFTNTATGVAEATGGGTLVLQNNGTFTGAGFLAADGSHITLTGNPNITAATLSTTGTGTIVNADNASLTNVTVNGTFNAANNSTTYVAGTLTNNGTFSLNSTGNGDDLHFVGATTLAGIGTVVLNGANDRVFAQNGGGDRLTIAPGASLTGNGNVGLGQSTFTNNGTVNANQSGNTLTLQPGGGNGSDFTTGATGVTEATGGGVMAQITGSFTNNGTYAVISNGTGGGSSLSVDAGHLTNFAGTTLTGGTYNVISSNASATSTLSFGGGTITTNAANVTLSGASTVFAEIGGLANNQGSFTVANGRNFTTVGALLSSGRLVSAGGSTLGVSGALTQSPTGTLTGNGAFTAASFSISGAVNPGGTVSATTGAFADAAGTTTLTGATTFNVDAQFHFELGSTTGTNDHLNVNGTLNLDGTLNVTALAGFGAGVYDLIDYPLGLGQFTNNFLTLGTLPAGYTYTINYAIPGQVDLVVTPNIPEPGAWTFVLGGAVLLMGVQRVRRNAGRGV